MVIITLQYTIKPNTEQEKLLKSNEGAVRYAYNWAIQRTYNDWNKANQAKQNGEEYTYQKYDMRTSRNEFNKIKDDIAPWWKENSKEAYNTGFQNAHYALNNYWQKRAKPPQYKKKHRDRLGIHYTAGGFKLIGFDKDQELSKNNPKNKRLYSHFQVPKVGKVKLLENPRKLVWLLRNEARIMSIWVKYSREHWRLSIILDTPDDVFLKYNDQRTKQDRKKVVGVDVGIKSAAVFSDGTFIDNPKKYERELRRLRRLSREVSRRGKNEIVDENTGEVRKSKRYETSVKKLRKQYAKISDFEIDFSHKLSKKLCDEYDTICVENLNVKGMVKNRKLARRVAHAGFGRFKIFLAYKAELYGNSVSFVGRFFPSSKRCSSCGAVKAKLSLGERIYSCEFCGFVMDRDLNAAVNIEQKGLRLLKESQDEVLGGMDAQSCGESLNGHGDRGADCSPSEAVNLITKCQVSPLKEKQPDNRSLKKDK